MSIKIPKKLITVVVLFVVFVTVIAIFGKPKQSPTSSAVLGDSIATVNVKAGYYPSEVTLPANKQTSLRFITNNTYDCSASLLIPKLQIEQFLPATGTTDIAIPAQAAGTEVIAGCSMGMYSFKIKFL